MVTLGISNEYLIVNFTRVGEDGITINIGKNRKLGVSVVTSLNHSHKSNNKDSKGNNNINRDPKSSSINNGGSNNRDNPRFKNLKVNNRDNPRFNSQNNNLRRKFSSHNTLSLKENLKEGRENIESRIAKSLKKLLSIISVG
jgi:hypothetical protein